MRHGGGSPPPAWPASRLPTPSVGRTSCRSRSPSTATSSTAQSTPNPSAALRSSGSQTLRPTRPSHYSSTITPPTGTNCGGYAPTAPAAWLTRRTPRAYAPCRRSPTATRASPPAGPCSPLTYTAGRAGPRRSRLRKSEMTRPPVASVVKVARRSGSRPAPPASSAGPRIRLRWWHRRQDRARHRSGLGQAPSMELGISLGNLQRDPETDHDHSAGQYAEQGGLVGTRGLAASQVGDHGSERGLRRFVPTYLISFSVGAARRARRAPGARSVLGSRAGPATSRGRR